MGIARALALNPSVILFDEPTSSLDPELVGEVLDTIKAINDKTIIIVTHELDFARALADRIIFLMEGDILEDSPPELLFTSPKHERTKQFLEKNMHLH